ncbi:MAG: cation diffusion facilitator family transporter [Muribaculaceae bacterium]|nr:cation diffusion facilitator family transporter [Muribaculaceae bacterium]
MTPAREKKIYKVTLIGSVVNIILVVFKFIAGVIGHSAAMIADAVHSLSDLLSDAVVLIFVKIAGKPEDEDHDYGHGKFETLASVIVGLLLGVVGIGLAWEGITKTIDFFKGEDLGSPNYWALSAAVLSIILKELLYRYTIKSGKSLDSSALIANAWHHRSDALTSIATLVGIAGAMIFGKNGRVLDPLAAVVVSGFIIKAAWVLMKPGLEELLEKSLSDEDKRHIGEMITSTPGVTGYHRLRTRRIGSHRAVEVHVKMPGDYTLTRAHEVASEIEKRIKKAYGSQTHVAVHMEPSRDTKI